MISDWLFGYYEIEHDGAVQTRIILLIALIVAVIGEVMSYRDNDGFGEIAMNVGALAVVGALFGLVLVGFGPAVLGAIFWLVFL